MKNILAILSVSVLIISCGQSNSTDDNSHLRDPLNEIKDSTSVEENIEIAQIDWKDSLSKLDVFDYALMLDSNILRNNNSRKMFLAQPKYTRSKEKGWKSAVIINLEKNFIQYQTTNGDEESKVMVYGPGYDDENNDTLSKIKVWKLNDSLNMVLQILSLEVSGTEANSISAKVFEHGKDGLVDKTNTYLPKVAYKDFVNVSLDSAGLEAPSHLPLVYRLDYKTNSILEISFNDDYYNLKKTYDENSEWREKYHITTKYSVNGYYTPSISYKMEDGKFRQLPFENK